MAIIFELWVECETKEQTEAVAQHFEGLSFTLLSGLEVTWQIVVEEIVSGTSGVSLWSQQLSPYGVRTVQDAVDMSECGIRLCHHLLSAPEFLFARVAVESNLSAQQLTDYFTPQPDGFRTTRLDCILHDKLAQELGPLRWFRQFRPGYVWNGYAGEDYRPLDSNDNEQLWQLKKELLGA